MPRSLRLKVIVWAQAQWHVVPGLPPLRPSKVAIRVQVCEHLTPARLPSLGEALKTRRDNQMLSKPNPHPAGSANKVRRPSPAIVISVVSLFVALSGTAYAATGGTFVLGKANTAGAVTKLTNSNGTALSLSSKSGTAPLAVNSSTLVPKLNASLLGGLTAGQFVQGSGDSGVNGSSLPTSPTTSGKELLVVPGFGTLEANCGINGDAEYGELTFLDESHTFHRYVSSIDAGSGAQVGGEDVDPSSTPSIIGLVTSPGSNLLWEHQYFHYVTVFGPTLVNHVAVVDAIIDVDNSSPHTCDFDATEYAGTGSTG
jgi:hypothetical protein